MKKPTMTEEGLGMGAKALQKSCAVLHGGIPFEPKIRK